MTVIDAVVPPHRRQPDMEEKKTGHAIPFHPLLCAIYPVVSVYSHNADHMPFAVMLRPALVSLATACLVWLMLRGLMRDWQRAALITSAAVLLFLCYGHILESAKSVFGAWLLHRYTLPAVGAVGILWFTVVWKYVSLTAVLTRIANWMSCVLLVVSCSLSVFGVLLAPGTPGARMDTDPLTTPSGDMPDIYYIILDGYGRADVLEELYAYDNSPFLLALERRGFYVASQSCANYMQTQLSLASSLNMSYLDDLVTQHGDRRSPPSPSALLRSSSVIRLLKGVGYTFVSFATGFTQTEFRGADYYESPLFALTEVENLLMTNTLWAQLTDSKFQYDLHRGRISYTLDELPRIVRLPGPKFVFAHIVAPHPPFVFDSAGRPVTHDVPFSIHDGIVLAAHGLQKEYVTGYTGQVGFLNTRILGVIDEILSKPGQEPVIVLQGDHGPRPGLYLGNRNNTDHWEWFSILNAFYVSEQARSRLYSSISPVNTFRMILSEYFRVDYPLLDDLSYFSTFQSPYCFVDVTADVRPE